MVLGGLVQFQLCYDIYKALYELCMAHWTNNSYLTWFIHNYCNSILIIRRSKRSTLENSWDYAAHVFSPPFICVCLYLGNRRDYDGSCIILLQNEKNLESPLGTS
jgi:hypothetical protein